MTPSLLRTFLPIPPFSLPLMRAFLPLPRGSPPPHWALLLSLLIVLLCACAVLPSCFLILSTQLLSLSHYHRRVSDQYFQHSIFSCVDDSLAGSFYFFYVSNAAVVAVGLQLKGRQEAAVTKRLLLVTEMLYWTCSLLGATLAISLAGTAIHQ